MRELQKRVSDFTTPCLPGAKGRGPWNAAPRMQDPPCLARSVVSTGDWGLLVPIRCLAGQGTRRCSVTTLLPCPSCPPNPHPPHPYSLAPIGQVQPHDSVMGLQEGRVGGQISRRARVRLHIDSPLRGIQVEGLQGPALTQQLNFIHYLCASVVPATRWGRSGRKKGSSIPCNQRQRAGKATPLYTLGGYRRVSPREHHP